MKAMIVISSLLLHPGCKKEEQNSNNVSTASSTASVASESSAASVSSASEASTASSTASGTPIVTFKDGYGCIDGRCYDAGGGCAPLDKRAGVSCKQELTDEEIKEHNIDISQVEIRRLTIDLSATSFTYNNQTVSASTKPDDLAKLFGNCFSEGENLYCGDKAKPKIRFDKNDQGLLKAYIHWPPPPALWKKAADTVRKDATIFAAKVDYKYDGTSKKIDGAKAPKLITKDLDNPARGPLSLYSIGRCNYEKRCCEGQFEDPASHSAAYIVDICFDDKNKINKLTIESDDHSLQ